MVCLSRHSVLGHSWCVSAGIASWGTHGVSQQAQLPGAKHCWARSMMRTRKEVGLQGLLDGILSRQHALMHTCTLQSVEPRATTNQVCAPRPGEKINLPSVPIPKVLTKLLTPRGTAPGPGSARSPRSDRSQPLSVRSERSNLLPGPGEEGSPAGSGLAGTGLLGAAATSSLGAGAASSLGAPSTRTSYAAGSSKAGQPTRGSYAARSSYSRSARSSYARNSYAARDSYAARASWFEYYHRPSQPPQPPKWRAKLQRGVRSVVQHPGGRRG
jgi:hypothetical protein